MNLGYTGKPYDPTTGLYDYGYRDYSPALARFTTVDPIRDGSNWFVYVNNDPVNWIDPWGLSASDKILVNSYGVSYVSNNQTITPFPVNNGEGYNGFKGRVQTVAESQRGKQVMLMIESYHFIIINEASVNNVNSNIIRAIIYEEQTHNKTPNLEMLPFIQSVGLMAIHKSNWGNYSRKDMLNPQINIAVGTKLVVESTNNVETDSQNPSVGLIASNYNNRNAITVITDYGKRVEAFYNWFEENYEE
jgi:RHS repeat-associated protein